MRSVPDFQREKLYRAERILRQIYDWATENENLAVEVAGVSLTLPPESKFANVDDVQRYCNMVTIMMRVPPVTVRKRRGDRHAHYEREGAVIAVPDDLLSWSKRELVVLHELAHHMCPEWGHGPAFVSAFVELLAKVMGPEAGLALRLICAENDVKEGSNA